MLIALKNITYEKLKLENDFVAMKIKQEELSIIICCLYNPSKTNQCRWKDHELLKLINCLNEKATHDYSNAKVIIGDVSFDCSNRRSHIKRKIRKSSIRKTIRDKFYGGPGENMEKAARYFTTNPNMINNTKNKASSVFHMARIKQSSYPYNAKPFVKQSN